MRRIIVVLLALMTVAHIAHAEPLWSWKRAAVGLDAKGAITESSTQSTSFLAGLAASYSMTSQFSVAATLEQDFANSLTISRMGVRFPIAYVDGGNGRLAASGGLVIYSGNGADDVLEPASWDAGLHGSWRLAENSQRTVLWGVGSAIYDPENARTTYRLGLRWNAWGGKP